MSKKVICEYAYPVEHAFLSTSINLTEMNEYLFKISKKVVKTSDGLGLRCVYIDVDCAEKKRSVQKDFEELTQVLEGLVTWLRLARHIDVDSRPIMAGSILFESDLLAAIEESQPLASQLELIAKKLKRAQKSIESKTKLSSVLGYLVNEGYLLNKAGTGSIYQATAKWSLLYDQLEFLAKAEGMLDVEEEASGVSQQMEIF